MILKQKILSTFLLALVVSSGTWVGFQWGRGEIDPQNYIQSVFTPYDDGIGHYLRFLDKAHQSVRIAGYSFTDDRIVERLIALKTHGVDVKVLLDYSQTRSSRDGKETALIDRLRAAQIEVVVGTSEKSHQLMHNKYTIVDGLWVQSGSWNYTWSANKQANEFDIIQSPKRAKLFLANWNRMYGFMKEQERHMVGENGRLSPKKTGRRRFGDPG